MKLKELMRKKLNNNIWYNLLWAGTERKMINFVLKYIRNAKES